MHMHKEHNGAGPVQKSCNMCLFTSHLSRVLKNNINSKHLGILKTLDVISVIFFAKSKGVQKHHEHLKHKIEATLICELWDCRTFIYQYLKSQMKDLCQADH